MNTVDWLLLIPPVYGLIRGAFRGLVGEVAALAAIAGGAVAAYAFPEPVASALVRVVGLKAEHAGPVAYALLFFTAALGIILLGKLMTKSIEALSLGGPNRLLGALFGLLKWTLIMALFAWIFVGFNQRAGLVDQEKLESSPVMGVYMTLGNWITPNGIREIEITIPEPL